MAAHCNISTIVWIIHTIWVNHSNLPWTSVSPPARHASHLGPKNITPCIHLPIQSFKISIISFKVFNHSKLRLYHSKFLLYHSRISLNQGFHWTTQNNFTVDFALITGRWVVLETCLTRCILVQSHPRNKVRKQLVLFRRNRALILFHQNVQRRS